MRDEQMIQLMHLALFCGQAVLILNFESVPEPISIIKDRTFVVTRDNLMEVLDRISTGIGGFYHDPDHLIDAAFVDKMIIV